MPGGEINADPNCRSHGGDANHHSDNLTGGDNLQRA
jgi:hypothetical protein